MHLKLFNSFFYLILRNCIPLFHNKILQMSYACNFIFVYLLDILIKKVLVWSFEQTR